MSMVKFILPQLALPLGEGVTPFVNAHSFMGGALHPICKFVSISIWYHEKKACPFCRK